MLGVAILELTSNCTSGEPGRVRVGKEARGRGFKGGEGEVGASVGWEGENCKHKAAIASEGEISSLPLAKMPVVNGPLRQPRLLLTCFSVLLSHSVESPSVQLSGVGLGKAIRGGPFRPTPAWWM